MNSRTFKRWLTALDDICNLPSSLGITITLIWGACAIKYMYDQQQLAHTSTSLAQWMAKNEFIALCKTQKVGLRLLLPPSRLSKSFRIELNQHQSLHNPISQPCNIALGKPVPPYSFVNSKNTRVVLEEQTAFKNGTVSPEILSKWRATQGALKDQIPWQEIVLMWCTLCIILNRRLVDRFIKFCMPARKNYTISYRHNGRRQKPMRGQVPRYLPSYTPWPVESKWKRRQRAASRIALFALLCFIVMVWISWRTPTKDDKCELFCEQTSISSDMDGFWEAAVPDPKLVEACWHTRCLTNLARRSVHAHEPTWLWGPWMTANLANHTMGWVKPWGPRMTAKLGNYTIE